MQRIVLITIIMLWGQASFSQHAEERGKVYLGIRAGYTRSSLFGKDLGRLSDGGAASSLGGLFAEIVANTRLSKHFGLTSSISVGQSGARLQILDSSVNQPYRSNFKSTYLTLQPFSPTLYLKGFRLYAGPYLSCLLNASIERRAADGSIYKDKSIFGTPLLPGGYRQKIDAGLLIGLDYKCSKAISVGIKYKRGAISVMEDSRVQSQWKIYNQELSISIGYNLTRK
ncbi:porin family protein [Chitinophaga sp. 212800010-3]|uniref:porin family protein n=1 Tax=unclassified Chitinophaga TaxID=2619133 RepID=UPI002DEFE651|nr:hypothetical protein [Chitinophaga sp. 212800010-3]